MKKINLIIAIAFLTILSAKSFGQLRPIGEPKQHVLSPYVKVANMAVDAKYEKNPCGIAISWLGKVALSFYNKNQKASVYVWNSISDFEKNSSIKIKLVDENGNEETELYNPESLTFMPDETLVVTETSGNETGLVVYKMVNGVYKRQLFNKYRFINLGFNNPRGVIAIDNTHVLLADDDNNQIWKIDITNIDGKDGVVIPKDQRFNNPKAVTTDGKYIAVSFWNGFVNFYDMNYKQVGEPVAINGSPLDLCFGIGGAYVTVLNSSNGNVIKHLFNNGTSFSLSPTIYGAQSNLDTPYGLATNGTTMYISNAGPNKIAKLINSGVLYKMMVPSKKQKDLKLSNGGDKLPL
ncbi:hypothetical protein EZJ43_11445 [Pedobacter changchengzhani]|uniref:SMP-30/Gluconolactonase/LRE-like region domain-containing protein n=1 Tax=Pedobacter changchengzhani TaxID=2529274 RepID=A0A4R5ML63_9SPHI|nr:hypothetical protein [Pedobacter changchengzhani]TDG35955.1 hypothetical protein EZJ43_11445 [Pedobacter changchengzhani]